MNGNRYGLKIALTILMISMIAMFAGCINSAGSGSGNISATNATAAGSPNNIAWFGSVQDSFGKPLEGVNVTLRLMTPAGEAFNRTTRSYVGMPYPGSYVFDNVSITPDITYAYATAEVGGLGDDVLYYGRSENYTTNKSRMSSGFIVLHVPMPDAVRVTPEHPTISSGISQPGSPNSTQVTAELYLNGKPYKRAGVQMNFTSDNNAVGTLPEIAGNVTDAEGRSTILLSGVGPGSVNVTGYTKIGISRNLTDTRTVQVA